MPPSLEALMTGASALLSTAMAFGPMVATWQRRSSRASATARVTARRRRVGPYVLLDRIAAGAMGEVYRARHGATGQLRAVKLLSRHAGERQRLQFEKEARFGERVRHPHQVSVYEHGEAPDGSLYFSMDLVDGVTLEALVERDGAQAPARVVTVLLQIAKALVEVHDRGFVHRDIKPSNILLCRDSNGGDCAKLLDFGLIKDLAEPCPSESHDSVVGTPLYLAPEALTAPDTVNGRTDLYGLGAVAYFLLRGAPVFTGTSVVEVCAQHLHTPPAPLRDAVSGLSSELEELVLQCLAKDAAARPASARELIRRLHRCREVEVGRKQRRWAEVDATGAARSSRGALPVDRDPLIRSMSACS